MKKSQTGRSMVEMLGVLAVMGVLSVGGIYGYSIAMTKNKANELLAEASKRATIVTAQILSGNEPHLGDFVSNNNFGYAEFLGTVDTLNDQFVIRLQNVDENVCKHVKNSVGSATIIRAVSDDCTGLTFNNDMSTTDTVDPESNECRYSPCQTCTDNGAGGQNRGFQPEGTPCVQAGIEGTCDNLGHCVPDSQDYCNGGGQCGAGYFCNYGGTGYGAGSNQKGETPQVCEKVSPRTATINGVKYYYNSLTDLKSWCRGADRSQNCTWGYLSHYGAEDWCRSIGKRLLTSAEFSAAYNDLVRILPSVDSGRMTTYWVAEGAMNSPNGVDTGRFDGYAGKGGVVCR